MDSKASGLSQKNIHIQQDVIEIHHSRLAAFPGIQLIYVADPRFPGRRIILLRQKHSCGRLPV